MSTSQPIRIVVIDDHSSVHFTIAKLLQLSEDMALVAQGSSGEDAIRLCEEFQPDLVLMDVIMPGLNGIDATTIIKEKFPHIKILALSGFQDHDSVQAMMDAGATGYVLKTASLEDIASTIRTAFAGNAVFSEAIMKALFHARPTEPTNPLFGLTPREREVLSLMVKGLNNTDIAAALVVSLSTVKHHVSNIFTKMGVASRVEAVALAVKNRLVS